MISMSAGNVTNYFNGTSSYDGKNKKFGFSSSQTVFLSLFVITSVILLSALAYYIVKKRALNKMKHHLVPLYHFDPGECDSWEDELMQGSTPRKSKTSHKYYRSVSSPIMTTAH